MLKPMLLALTIFGAQAALAQDYSFEYSRERGVLDIECRGYIDKFSIYVNTVMDPDKPKDAVTSLEIGYVLKTWAPKRDFEFVEPKATGGHVGIEGSVGVGQGAYKYNMPYWGGNMTDSTKSFTTGLTLKTGIVNGNVTLDCKATLKQIKSKVKSSYN